MRRILEKVEVLAQIAPHNVQASKRTEEVDVDQIETEKASKNPETLQKNDLTVNHDVQIGDGNNQTTLRAILYLSRT